MINIVWDQGFKRVYKKKIKQNDELKRRFWDTVKIFSRDPFDQKLKTHKLTGKLQGLWAFSVDYNCRVIFRFLGKNDVLLVDIGGHDEVY
jgi:mRNA-degrading endonuclease YafQ of YafQ-DinJ toxin-antitoxin module